MPQLTPQERVLDYVRWHGLAYEAATPSEELEEILSIHFGLVAEDAQQLIAELVEASHLQPHQGKFILGNTPLKVT